MNDGKGYKKHPSTSISSNNEFEVSFTGLTSGHVYNYRAYIDDGTGSYGVEKNFTTLPPASYTATINPTTIENHSVAVSFTLTDRLKEWGVYYSETDVTINDPVKKESQEDFVVLTELKKNTTYNILPYIIDKDDKIIHLEKIIFKTTVGLDITNKKDLISICYTTWFTRIHGLGTAEPNPRNISEILAGRQEWGSVGQFHYWSKPALGYYRSHDKEVIRQHMTWLAEAKVDFIIIDNTNASVGWAETNDWNLYISIPCTAILDVMKEMRQEGKDVPYLVFWSKIPVMDKTYNEFYANGKYKDSFVYWDGKPLILSTTEINNAPQAFTVRHMWGLKQNPKVQQWSFLNVKNIPSYDTKGNVEQMAVCTAAQETYMTEPTAHGRNNGNFFYEQWKRAFEHRPKVITLTWWNEWTAQRFLDDNGNSRFVDNYTQEYSRDIEPMEGGHGDLYYQWMKQYISAYKNEENCPKLVE